jgi:glutamate racemase
MGRQVRVISSAAAAAAAIGPYFKRHPTLEKSLSGGGTRRYLTTDCPERFSELGSMFLGQKITAEKVLADQ